MKKINADIKSKEEEMGALQAKHRIVVKRSK